MAGKGAPEGNTYAKKEDTGKPLTLYLKAEDMELLRVVLQQSGKEPTDKECRKLARKAAHAGINRLLLPVKDVEI
jgi:hypothetical protein